jgi:hypothetical protein
MHTHCDIAQIPATTLSLPAAQSVVPTMARLSHNANTARHHRTKPRVSIRTQVERREKQEKLTGAINGARDQYLETADGLATEYGQ